VTDVSAFNRYTVSREKCDSAYALRSSVCVCPPLNQFLTVAIEGEESLYTESKRFLISLRDFPSKKQESNHRPILLFFHFSKIRGHARFHTQSKQNYESDSAEVLTVAVYENVLHCSKFLLR